MSKQIAAALAAPFTGADLKSRPGRGGMTFTYADARAVAQRLDDVLGLAGWQFEVKIGTVFERGHIARADSRNLPVAKLEAVEVLGGPENE